METAAPMTLDHLPAHYVDASGVDTPDPSTAAAAAYVTPTGQVLLRLTRTRRGRWAYAGSDVPAGILARKRWASPEIALANVAWLRGYLFTQEVPR